jgi:hypothetical protein
LEDAIYVYNSSTGTYAYHCPADSTPINGNGGSQYIASQQAFWVKANAGSAALVANENVKAVSQNPSLLRMAQSPNTSNYPSAFKDFPVPQSVNNTPGRLKLTSSGSGVDDEIFIHFNLNATDNYDSKYDAYKLLNPNAAVQNFSSVMNGTDLSVNGLPSLTSDVHIPLRLTVPATGTYKIARDSMLMLPMSSCIMLEDKAVPAMIDLRTNVSYTFTISDTTVLPRFVLHIYAPLVKKAVSATCSAGNNGMAIAKGIGAGPWNYIWKNSAGTVLKTTLASISEDTLFNCAAGTYSVNVTGSACGAVTDTVVVKAPALLASSVSQVNESCFGGNDASATVLPSGGVSFYSYLWGNGQTTSAAVNLSFGNYSVTITDSHGCTTTASVSITQPTQLSKIISPTNISCFGLSNGMASVDPSGGTPAYSYLWSNGQTTSAAVNLSVGSYSVVVTDAMGCTATTSVIVTQPTQLSKTISPTNVSCFGFGNGMASISASGGTPSYSYAWGNGQTTSAAVNLSAGTYSVAVTDGHGCILTATVGITQPALLSNTVSSTDVSCFGLNDGSASVSASGGTPSYSYLWNNGQTLATAVNLSMGNYSVSITDSKGCASTASVTVTEPAVVFAGFTTSADTIDLASGSTSITFTNGSSGAVTYQWDFGDGSGDASVNPVHDYTLVGTFTVSLVSSNAASCSDVAHKTIVVVNSNPTALLENDPSLSVNVIYENGEIFLQFSLAQATPVDIRVYNAIGEKIISQNNLIVKNEKVKLSFPSSAAGIYVAVSEMASNGAAGKEHIMVSKKIVIPSR